MGRRSICLALVALALDVGSARAGALDCLTNWSVAAQIVKSEGLATVRQLSERAMSSVGGDIIKTVLCKENGGYVYRLVVREPNGRLKNVTVDAHEPFQR